MVSLARWVDNLKENEIDSKLIFCKCLIFCVCVRAHLYRQSVIMLHLIFTIPNRIPSQTPPLATFHISLTALAPKNHLCPNSFHISKMQKIPSKAKHIHFSHSEKTIFLIPPFNSLLFTIIIPLQPKKSINPPLPPFLPSLSYNIHILHSPLNPNLKHHKEE